MGAYTEKPSECIQEHHHFIEAPKMGGGRSHGDGSQDNTINRFKNMLLSAHSSTGTLSYRTHKDVAYFANTAECGFSLLPLPSPDPLSSRSEYVSILRS